MSQMMPQTTPLFARRRPGLLLSLGLAVALALGAGQSFGAEEAQDPDVRARIALMQELKSATGLFADMAEGRKPFDAAALEAAIEAFRTKADQVEVVFKPRADDPASEALPDIWNAPAEFRQKVSRMMRAANGLEGASPRALADTLAPVTAACKDCHGRFKM